MQGNTSIILKNDINQFGIQYIKIAKEKSWTKVSNKLKGHLKIDVRFKFFFFFSVEIVECIIYPKDHYLFSKFSMASVKSYFSAFAKKASIGFHFYWERAKVN